MKRIVIGVIAAVLGMVALGLQDQLAEAFTGGLNGVVDRGIYDGVQYGGIGLLVLGVALIAWGAAKRGAKPPG